MYSARTRLYLPLRGRKRCKMRLLPMNNTLKCRKSLRNNCYVMGPQSIIHLENIRKSYFIGRNELPVLKGISLDILKNEYVALMGPSGSGKSTLMNMLGCLDSPTTGQYILNGHAVSQM